MNIILISDVDAFWRRVKALIKLKSVTMAEAAKACDLPYSTFRGWVYKRIIPTIFDAYRLARYLGVSMEYLVCGKDRSSRMNREVLDLLEKAEAKLRKVRRRTS